MDWLKNFLEGKGWLLYGSIVGGILGAISMYLNYIISPEEQIMMSMPVSFPLAVGLGMMGGLIGGAIGSFAAGIYVRENMLFNVGESLGMGLVNGFVAGILVGTILGCANLWRPGSVTAIPLIGLGLITVIIAAVIFIIKRGRL